MSSAEGSYFFQKCLHAILFLQSFLDELLSKNPGSLDFLLNVLWICPFWCVFFQIHSGKNSKVVFKSQSSPASSFQSRHGWAWFLQIYKLGNLQAGQISGEEFVIWKCLTVQLTFCIVFLLSFQGLNMILSKLDNPEKSSQLLCSLPDSYNHSLGGIGYYDNIIAIVL